MMNICKIKEKVEEFKTLNVGTPEYTIYSFDKDTIEIIFKKRGIYNAT